MPDCTCGHPADEHPPIWSIAGDATTRCAHEGCRCDDYDEPGTDLVPLPDGQLVDLSNPTDVALRLDDLRTLEARVREAKTLLVDAIQQYAETAGKGKTLHLPEGLTVVLKNDTQVLWDAQQLEADLREAGMAEERIREIVVEEVSYRVAAAEAKKAASVNAAYAEAVSGARKEVPKRPSVTVERG